MSSESPKDLIVLVPGRDEWAALEGILSGHHKLGIRPVSVEFLIHPDHDPGCWIQAHEFLRNKVNQFVYALVMFDRQGSGAEDQSREELEWNVELRLAKSGWDNRAAAIVVDPELEAWIWGSSTHVDRCLGWQGRQPELREWLREREMWLAGAAKPLNPKAATEAAMKKVRRPRSSAVYKQLAQSVSFHRCRDPAFLKLRNVLTKWFSQEVSD